MLQIPEVAREVCMNGIALSYTLLSFVVYSVNPPIEVHVVCIVLM